MPNKNYVNGRRKEYKCVHAFKDSGMVSFRSAGSHSPIDVVGIDYRNKRIFLVQCKPRSMSDNKKEEIAELNKGLNGTYEVRFLVE